MKEGIRKKHGFHKTKDVFAFDEGLVEKQATFLLTVRPILAVFSALDRVGEEEDETEAPDPDVIKGMLEDALVFLGNTTVRLNSWRQRRFSEYLTADNTSIGGRWSPEESQQHISVLESKQRILPSRLSQGIGNHHQLIFTCAWTTPQRWSISTRGGGGTRSPSLSGIELELWSLVLMIGSWVTATHIPGILNVDADTASRQFNPRVEWTLDLDR